MSLVLPEMIFFDFGGTLVNDRPFDIEAAGRALYGCADNPEASSADTTAAIWSEVYTTACRRTHPDGVGLEISMTAMIRCALARAGLRTAISPVELETAVQWQGKIHPTMPDINRLLSWLHGHGIRTAVISNFSISSETLLRRIDLSLPDNRFEFVITSADYVFCKPSPLLFDAALKKAGVAPERCWYCGNDFSADVVGAVSSGMFPVLLDLSSETAISMDIFEKSEFVRVNSWNALISLLQRL